MKYIPRNVLAVIAKISYIDVGLSIIFDIVTLLIDGIVTTLILCGKYVLILLIDTLQKIFSQYWVILLFVVIMILFMSIIILKNRIHILIKRYQIIFKTNIISFSICIIFNFVCIEFYIYI